MSLPRIVIVGGVLAGLTAGRRVLTSEGRGLSYDLLVLAPGARQSYFGSDDWAPFAPGLKSVSDAALTRRKILLAFEAAEPDSATSLPPRSFAIRKLIANRKRRLAY